MSKPSNSRGRTRGQAYERHDRTAQCVLRRSECSLPNAMGIKYVETQLRVSRTDYAVDFLAPWFEPNREALVVPPGTKITEYTGIDETATMASGSRVTGLRAGAIANRQLAIYDKRAEIIQQGKMGWLPIWNAALAAKGKPPLDLKYRHASQVWRIELRLGSKQLRNRFEMRSWQDMHDMIGDAFTDALEVIRVWLGWRSQSFSYPFDVCGWLNRWQRLVARFATVILRDLNGW